MTATIIPLGHKPNSELRGRLSHLVDCDSITRSHIDSFVLSIVNCAFYCMCTTFHVVTAFCQ